MSLKNVSLFTPVVGILLVAALTGSALGQQPGGTEPKRPTQPTQPTPPAPQRPVIGKAAPAFELKDTDGKAHKLEEYKGKAVVLFWWNPTCADVRQQFGQGTMKSLLAEFEGKGVTWFGVNSTPADQKGGGLEASMKGRQEMNIKFPVLLDEKGVTAKTYNATKTPTVSVIDGNGVLVYWGAVDNAPGGKLPEGAKLVNYLRDAINAAMSGSTLTTNRTDATGCPIRISDAG